MKLLKIGFTGLLFITMLLVVCQTTTYAQTENGQNTETVYLETQTNVDMEVPNTAVKSDYQEFLDLYNQICYGTTTEVQKVRTYSNYSNWEPRAYIVYSNLGLYQNPCTYPVRYFEAPKIVYVYSYN